MASAWGLAWGRSWGVAWGDIGVSAPVVAPPQPAGRPFWARERLFDEPEVIEVIQKVAERQVQDLHLDDTQRVEELLGELKLRSIEFDRVYLEALQQAREFLIEEEIRKIVESRRREEEALIMILLTQL